MVVEPTVGVRTSPFETAVSRRGFVTAAVTVAACALASATRANADAPAGYATLSGVAGVDPATVFPTFSEAVSAVAACDPALQDPSSGASVVVHGTMVLGGADGSSSSFDLAYPVDGATVAVMGADDASCLQVASDASPDAVLALSFASGSLVVRNLDVVGALSCTARDGLAVDACTFVRTLACAAGGPVNVSGNAFVSGGLVAGPAVLANLEGFGVQLAFSGNTVSGFSCAVAATNASGSSGTRVSVTSSDLELAPDGSEWDCSCSIRLAGGPWGAASLARDGNAVTGARSLLVLDDSFSASTVEEGVEVVRSVAADDLDAQTIVSLFEMLGAGSSSLPDGFVGVSLSSPHTGSYVAEQVAIAAESVIPSATATDQGLLEAESSEDGTSDPGEVVYTVSYDANGATAGSAPDAVQVVSGSAVTVSDMGSLVSAGRVFEGWNTASDGSGAFYASGQVFVPTCDTVLYAQWASTGTVAQIAVGDSGEGV